MEKTGDDDKIRFSTRDAEDTGLASVERMTIDNQGNTRIGDDTNNTYIESDGSLSYEGTANRWDDLKISVNAVAKKEGDADPATYDVFISGLAALKFKNDKDRSVFFTLQMPHAWKDGINIFPHVNVYI